MIETLARWGVDIPLYDPRRAAPAAMTTLRIQVTASTKVRDGHLVLPFAALPSGSRNLGAELVLFEPGSRWEAPGRIVDTDQTRQEALVDVPSLPPEGKPMTIAPSRTADWNGPTMIGQIVPLRVPQPPPAVRTLPPVLAIVPLGTDLLLQTEILRAVALWYEREYDRAMPAGCARQERTTSGAALVIYARPVA